MAGSMNALAGGGTFFSFPALLAAGIPPVMANASNTVALWPASLSSAWVYRKELEKHKSWVIALTIIAVIGGEAPPSPQLPGPGAGNSTPVLESMAA